MGLSVFLCVRVSVFVGVTLFKNMCACVCVCVCVYVRLSICLYVGVCLQVFLSV